VSHVACILYAARLWVLRLTLKLNVALPTLFFKSPAEQVYDKVVDDDTPMQSHLGSFPERLELIQAADVIFWDEAMAKHRECLEAVLARSFPVGTFQRYACYCMHA